MASSKKIQIIILGDGAVGKTSLLKMYFLPHPPHPPF